MKSIYQKFLALILFTPLTAIADWGLNMTQGVTPISNEIYDMHMLTLCVVTIIGILVFGVMFWSIFHHRKSKGAKAAKFSHSTTVEIIWTIDQNITPNTNMPIIVTTQSVSMCIS